MQIDLTKDSYLLIPRFRAANSSFKNSLPNLCLILTYTANYSFYSHPLLNKSLIMVPRIQPLTNLLTARNDNLLYYSLSCSSH